MNFPFYTDIGLSRFLKLHFKLDSIVLHGLNSLIILDLFNKTAMISKLQSLKQLKYHKVRLFPDVSFSIIIQKTIKLKIVRQ